MRTALTLCFALGLCTAASQAAPTTPAPGSADRQAICDAVRHFLAKQRGKSEERRLFKIEALRADGGYAYFEGFFADADGSPSAAGTADDVVFNMFLKKEGKTWRVIRDLSRTDVPSDEEQREIRRDFPKEIPVTIIPPFWRDILGKHPFPTQTEMGPAGIEPAIPAEKY
jgi:hypothetical protein